jgi:hypothetical protein
MVVMEEIAAADPQLAAEAVPVLQDRYADLDDPARGDVLYIIGATGRRRILPFLEDVMAESANADLRQAAQEAIAAIQIRKDAD